MEEKQRGFKIIIVGHSVHESSYFEFYHKIPIEDICQEVISEKIDIDNEFELSNSNCRSLEFLVDDVDINRLFAVNRIRDISRELMTSCLECDKIMGVRSGWINPQKIPIPSKPTLKSKARIMCRNSLK